MVYSLILVIFLVINFSFYTSAYCIQNKTMDSFMYILLHKMKICLHLSYLILTKILHSSHITLMIILVRLIILNLILHPFCIALFIPIFKTNLDHFSYLMSFMIFLQSTINIFLDLMGNMITLQLRNKFKLLRISSILLK